MALSKYERRAIAIQNMRKMFGDDVNDENLDELLAAMEVLRKDPNNEMYDRVTNVMFYEDRQHTMYDVIEAARDVTMRNDVFAHEAEIREQAERAAEEEMQEIDRDIQDELDDYGLYLDDDESYETYDGSENEWDTGYDAPELDVPEDVDIPELSYPIPEEVEKEKIPEKIVKAVGKIIEKGKEIVNNVFDFFRR